MWWRGNSSEVKERTKNATEKTRSKFDVLVNIFNRQDFDNSLWDDLEEALISADVGLPTTEYILERVRKNVQEKKIKSASDVRLFLRDELVAILETPLSRVPIWGSPENEIPQPFAILVVGVNGGENGLVCVLSHIKMDPILVLSHSMRLPLQRLII